MASAAIVADAGPRDAPLGEVSIRLAEALGGMHVIPALERACRMAHFSTCSSPRSHSTPPWPVTTDAIETRAEAALAAICGWERVLPCVAT
jgi:hypothetical protein